MEEGRKPVWGIIAGILIGPHLRTTEDLRDSRPSPRTESLVASAAANKDQPDGKKYARILPHREEPNRSYGQGVHFLQEDSPDPIGEALQNL